MVTDIRGRCAHCARKGLLTYPTYAPKYCDHICGFACEKGNDAGHKEPSERMLMNDAAEIAVPVSDSRGDFILRALNYREPERR